MIRQLVAGALAAGLLAVIGVEAQTPPPFAGRRPPLASESARDAEALLARARQQPQQRFAEAGRLGAQAVSSRDDRSFALVWRPAAEPAGWIVTLHGSHSWAHDEIVIWQPLAARRQLGIIALQWWFGGGESTEDYYTPPELRRELETLMAQAGARRDNVVLHGFSRASANLYALVAMDRSLPAPLFTHVIANAGGMSAGYPPNRAIEASGGTPFAGTSWWLYCGGNDANPDRDGCPAMSRSQEWLARLGGKAELHEDAGGDHGGFHRRIANAEAALDWFQQRPAAH
jgi:hypothetical protein